MDYASSCHGFRTAYAHVVRKVLLLVVFMFAAMVAASGQTGDAQATFTVENVPNVRLTDVRLHVSDPASLLSATARDTINAALSSLETSTGIEVAVVVLPSIGTADPFDFGVSLFRSWGVGKSKNNNGLLILYVEDQHTVRFTTGYGIEGTLPDALCKRIQMRYMVPKFKTGDRDGGMVAGVKAVVAVLDGSMKPENDADNDGWVSAFVVFIGILAIIYLVVHRTKSRCPQCGAKTLMHKSTDHYRINGMRYRKDIYVCSKCGKVIVKNTPEDDRNNDDGMGAMLTGMMLGSMFGRGGRGGSGGSFGGSFGGGDTGGGGSGSSW